MLRRPRFVAWLLSRRPRRSAASHRFLPRLDNLEDRMAPSVTPTHFYGLDSGFTDQNGGPALIADGGSLAAGRYVFGPNQGLRLSGALADTANYSVVMTLQLNTLLNAFDKLIDFQERSLDYGLYVAGSNVQLYPGVPGSGVVWANQDFQVVLTHDQASGTTNVYLSGVLQQTYTGFAASVAVPGTNVLTFFEDDVQTGMREAAAGSVDYIATFDRALSAAEVAQLGTLGQQANTPPVITSLVSSNPTAAHTSGNGQVTISGAFTDPDATDTHTVTVDWGDGSAPQTVAVDETHHTFAGAHAYKSGGIFTIAVTIDDGHGGQDSKSTTAVVAGIGQVGGVLYVIGTDAADDIRIDLCKASGGPKGTKGAPVLCVTARFGSTAGPATRPVTVTLDPATVTQIVVLAGGGNDKVIVGKNVTTNAFILGGAGNDHLHGGGGNDVLVGGDGNDRLSGGKGSNILIGGAGKDKLRGKASANLKVAGPAPLQNDLNALSAALTAWLAGDRAGALAALGLS